MSLILAEGFAPIPDVSQTLGPTAAFWLTAYGALVVVLCVGGGIVELVWKRSALLLCCTIGAFFTPFIEPLWDVMGHLHFNPGATVAFTAFPQLQYPIEYPLWSVLTYVAFTGLAPWLFYKVLNADPSRRMFWGGLVVGQIVMNIVLEWVLIHSGGYQYYGDNQPFRVLGFPLWWVATNFGELFAAAVFVVLIRLYGQRVALAAIVIVPASFAAWELWAGWPVFVALNIDVGPVVTTLAAVLAFAICGVTLWFIERLFVVRRVDSWLPVQPKSPAEAVDASHQKLGEPSL